MKGYYKISNEDSIAYIKSSSPDKISIVFIQPDKINEYILRTWTNYDKFRIYLKIKKNLVFNFYRYIQLGYFDKTGQYFSQDRRYVFNDSEQQFLLYIIKKCLVKNKWKIPSHYIQMDNLNDGIMKEDQKKLHAYSGAAEPQFRSGVSHQSGTTEPPFRLLRAINCLNFC